MVETVTFVTREGCHLCAEAQPVVARVARSAGVVLVVRDVDRDADSDPTLRDWSDHVPVVLLDGVMFSRWWIDEQALHAALHRR